MSRPPSGKRPPKKTDPVVVRLSHQTKEAFLAACRREGRTASAILRQLIESYLQRVTMGERLRDVQPERSLAMILSSARVRIAAAASVFAGVLAALAVSVAPSAADLDLGASFAAMDADGDGRVTLTEFAYPGAADESAVAVVRAARQGVIGIGRIGREGGVGVAEYWIPVPPSGWPAEAASPEPGDAEWAEELRQSAFTGFDGDGDGVVDYTEFAAGHLLRIERTFRMLDANVDGVVSPEEFNEPIRYEFTAPAGVASPAVSTLSEAAFRSLDRDGDDKIAPDEFMSGPEG